MTTERKLDITAWVLQGLMALAFFAAGGVKLWGDPNAVAMFDALGLGQWFRYVTGVIEVGGAVLLLIPGAAALGAALMVVTMVGAVLSHAVIGGSAIPAAIFLLICAAILWLRRAQIDALRARFAG